MKATQLEMTPASIKPALVNLINASGGAQAVLPYIWNWYYDDVEVLTKVNVKDKRRWIHAKSDLASLIDVKSNKFLLIEEMLSICYKWDLDSNNISLLLKKDFSFEIIKKFAVLDGEIVEVISVGNYHIARIRLPNLARHVFVSVSTGGPDRHFICEVEALHCEIAGKHADLLFDLNRLACEENK